MANHLLRMGKRLNFTSPDGAPHPQSFWCLDRMLLEISDRALRLRFIGYHDAASYDADRQPVAGAVKEYLISGQAFTDATGLPTQGVAVPISVEVLRLAWAVALNEKEIVPDPAHPDNKVSFFDGAVDVS